MIRIRIKKKKNQQQQQQLKKKRLIAVKGVAIIPAQIKKNK